MDCPSEPPNALQVEDASPETGTVLASSHYGEASSEYPDTPEPTANNVLLLTGVAQVRDTQRNQWKNVEILLDTGADESFITDTLANELGLERTTTKIFHIYTFGTEQPKRIACNLTTLGLWDRTGIKHNMRLHTLPVITKANKSARLSTEDLAFIKQRQIPLSKAHHEGTSKPQILIGCDQLWSLLDVSHPRYTLPSGLHLIPSKLGYLLTGKQSANELQEGTQKLFDGEIKVKPATVNTFVNFEMDSEEDIDRWDKYWAMDSAGICEFTGTKNAEKNAINEEVARFFEETIEKRPDGYYIRFPFKKNHPPLPSNRAIAMKRLHSVFHMLQKTPQLLQDYNNIIVSQQELGIIEPISEKSSGEGSLVHYIPHQPVITPQKETTKLRIVFDASAHFKDCPSLNDILHQGPLILPELYAMLLRFRVAPYVVISDVEKAFLQVRLQEIDRDVTRFLWVRDISTPLDDSNIIAYRFTRVTFGLNVSPYLLGGTIHHHLRCAVSDADLAKEIRENLYVDNLILSGETPEEVAKKSLTARKLFSEMGMNLREFTSNDLSLRNKLPEEACSTPSPKKVLGILWDAQDDSLIMRCSLPPSNTITKRLVARQIASIYDPFGWLVPLITPAKRFQQDLWRQRIQWDTELPSDTRRKWETITNNINGFSRSFPRRFCASSDRLNLAVFADASEIALATCAYLFNSSTSTLVMAKSKLPSIKAKTTIPKLEMNAVTMAMRLTHSIVRALNSQQSACPKTVYVFSDSQIALNWLSSPKCTNVGVLVENRVREIREIVRYLSEKESVNAIFGYVHTSQNPADAGTRGLDKQQISDSDWWAGPVFLRAPINAWPVEFYPSVMAHDPTQDEAANQDTAHITAAYTTTTATSELLDWNRFSSFLAGTRVTALVLRFVKKILRPLGKIRKKVLNKIPELKHISDTSNSLSSVELEAAKKVLFRDHQFVHLTKEYRKSMENTLRLYEDEQRIWRSRGRLKYSALPDSAKTPIFIVPNTLLAQRLIQEAHGNYHRGIEHTIATIREQYWIPKLRQQVRKLVTHCIPCRKFNALPYRYPDTPDLPSRRVVRSHPFQHTGLDFFDLPSCHENGGNQKLYGCIFTCTTTRLIHLEVIRSLGTEEFMNALRRFIARRGLPESVTCDNAPTFILSAAILDNQLNELHEELQRSIANKGIKWNHITPYAPWQGGLYERLIKSIKHALYKALTGARQRSFDEIHTTVIEIEACLNSRPLTYQSSTQEDFTSVRPIDFLQRDIVVKFPEIETAENDDPLYLPSDARRTLQNRQQVIEAIQSSIKETEKFWRIWQEQYLTSLREIQKKLPTNSRLGQNIPAVGDVVLVSDPVLPRHEWRMARITNIKKGGDGKIREVELRTSNRRTIRRPVNLLIPLEVQETAERSGSQTTSSTEPQNPEAVHSPVRGTTHYDLRRRRPVHYAESNTCTSAMTFPKTSRNSKWFLFYMMILSLFGHTLGKESPSVQLSCTEKGIRVNSTAPLAFEVCADMTCKMEHSDGTPQIIRFPPEVTLHDHKVVLKWHANGQLAVIETTCEGLDFCANVDCWVCTSTFLNPECRPHGAIFVLVLTLYGILGLIYALLYVPVVIGKPLRLLLAGGVSLVRCLLYAVCQLLLKLVQKLRIRSRSSLNARLTAALAIIASLCSMVQPAFSCQEVNLLEHHATVCTNKDGKALCSVRLTEVLKLNTFTQHACLRLVSNSTLVANVKIRWKGLYLRCEEETEYYTRSTTVHVVDSKRCPYMGSCSGEKCASVNSTSMIPELESGNSYPGRTDCFESCGGWGCDCASFSSGCLFFRLFVKPNNPTIYRIFRCLRWTEEVKVEIIIEDLYSNEGRYWYVAQLVPNVPVNFETVQITMTSLTMPPTPQLNSAFITNGYDTAVWTSTITPNLLCESQSAAETLNCTFSENYHLQTLTSLHDTLANLRLNVQNMKDQETLAFENYVRSTLSKLEQLTMEVKTIVVESALSRERNPDPPEHDNVGEREGIQRIQEEDDIIERNANFMEGIEEPEEGAEEGDWEPAEPEEVAEEGDWEPAEPEEAGEEEEGEPVGAEEDPVDDFPNGLMEEDDEAISRIQRELRNTEQAILDFDRMLRHLEVERLCPPRRYDQGHINKAHERFMRCVFCEAVGHHYSDSCTVVRDVASRNQLIESSKRCKQCLEVICARGLACKKNLTICFYCRRRGHHSALCEFPDYCDTIRSRKANAHEARRRSFAKLLRLREELASLENHP
uniref:DUF1758 domain-containing protein n=1 Tax=Haemonchus contortus TaxID=6289 RepID=A0A7I4XZ14_HAECO